MSKKAAIQLALATQMAIDGKPPIGLRATLVAAPLTVPVALPNPATPVAVEAQVRQLRDFAEGWRTGAGGAGYDANDLRNFLAQVAFILRTDDPPLKFNWSKIDPAAAAQCSLYALIDMIASETTDTGNKTADTK